MSLIDGVRVLRRYWAMQLAIVAFGCLLTVVVVRFMRPQFEATASVLPPPETPAASLPAVLVGGQSQSSVVGALMQGLMQTRTNKDTLLAILRSRTMKDEIIQRFDLVKHYRLEKARTPMRDARKRLAKMLDVTVSREGVIGVTAWALDPQTAADIANFAVDKLDRLNTLMNVTDASRTRLFLTDQVAQARRALAKAEEQLLEYQSKSKAVLIEEQTKAAIEAMATLEGQILAAEVQLRTLESFATPRNPEVIRLRASIEEMRQQLKKREYGRHGAVGGQRGASMSDFYVPLGSIPTAALDTVRLIREAKLQETLLAALTQELEHAKLAEAKDTPTITVLDRAVPAEASTFPDLILMLVLSAVFATFSAMALAFFLDYLARVNRQLS